MDIDCKYEDSCQNAGKSCFKCFDYSFYSEIKEKQGLRKRSLTNSQKKEGISFENRGAKKYSQAVKHSKDAARRQIGSGAFGGMLGDVITEEELTSSISEFKERGGVDARGKKQITIKKEWLDKLKEEADHMHKDYYFLPFSFKGEDTDYVAMEYDILLSYIQTIQFLHERIKVLEGDDES